MPWRKSLTPGCLQFKDAFTDAEVSPCRCSRSCDHIVSLFICIKSASFQITVLQIAVSVIVPSLLWCPGSFIGLSSVFAYGRHTPCLSSCLGLSICPNPSSSSSSSQLSVAVPHISGSCWSLAVGCLSSL